MVAKQNTNTQRYLLILGFLVLLGATVYLLRSVILPFAVGIVAAYFLNPLTQWLIKRCKMSHSLAAIIVLAVFLLILLPLLVFLGSIAVVQIGAFMAHFPQYISTFGHKLVDLLENVKAHLPVLASVDFKELWQDNWAESLKPALKLLRKLVSNGFAFINILSLLLISPVVAFYMLRDWTVFTDGIFDLVPKKHQKTFREGAATVSRIISGYLRGQMTVCVALGCFYSLGLWLVGLDLGVLVGFLAGIISFIPYVGSITGFLIAMVLAVTQCGTLAFILEVVAVFVIGQFLEGNVLTPKLVGENLGLHPVWVMFALLAGGALMGLLGMIIAVPMAAIIGVALKYAVKHYKKSQIYLEA
ncbi:MAG: AI-2E family transporter [Alphaproteobacteria bacterium]|nr:AI-2E family transporter [Alphaproteobacteria bacterium]